MTLGISTNVLLGVSTNREKTIRSQHLGWIGVNTRPLEKFQVETFIRKK
jgi:hypothetical protein